MDLTEHLSRSLSLRLYYYLDRILSLSYELEAKARLFQAQPVSNHLININPPRLN